MSTKQKKSPLAIKSNLKAGFNSHAQERAPGFVVSQASTKLTHYAQLIK